MNEGEMFKDLAAKAQELQEILKAKLRGFLMTKNKEEMKHVLRTEFAKDDIQEVCDWAIEYEEYEICAAVQEVLAEWDDIIPNTTVPTDI